MEVIEQEVSYSEIDSARACLHQHELSYRERWTTSQDPAWATIGRAWHRVLEAHYRHSMGHTGDGEPGPDDIIVSYGEDDEELGDLLDWMYDGYVRTFGSEPEWKVVAVEHESKVPLPELYPGYRFILKVKLDLVVQQGPRLWLVDHQTGKDVPSEEEAEFIKLEQFGLYTWAMRQMGKPVFGQILNFARKARLKRPMTIDERFFRHLSVKTDQELNTLAEEAVHSAYLAWGVFEPGQAPRSPEANKCKYRCRFRIACQHGRRTTFEQERDFLRAKGFVQDWSRH